MKSQKMFIFALSISLGGLVLVSKSAFGLHNNITVSCKASPPICLLDAVFYCGLMEYIRTRLTNKVYLPLALIRDAVANNYLDSLCYYVWIKKLHSKPIVYNYSLRKIGAAINCSPTTIKTHILVLKRVGLVEIGAGNLILKSTRSFYAEKQLMVPVKVSHNKSEQRDLLRFAIIKRNLHQQVRQYQTKSNALLFTKGLVHGYKAVKRALKAVKNYSDPIALENSMQNCLTLSNQKLGSLCNRSQSTGLKIQKALNHLSVLVSSKRTKLIDPKSHNRREFYYLNAPNSYFLSKRGQIYQRLTNGLQLTSE